MLLQASCPPPPRARWLICESASRRRRKYGEHISTSQPSTVLPGPVGTLWSRGTGVSFCLMGGMRNRRCGNTCQTGDSRVCAYL